MTRQIEFINKINFEISYTETERKRHFKEIELHTHNKLEIYINLAGDISFLVENNLYPLSRGDLIIARPGEYHHCVYRSDARHKLFWLLIDTNTELLSFFNNSKSNYISPDKFTKEEIIDCCFKLMDETISEFDKTFFTLKFFNNIKNELENNADLKSNMPKELKDALSYIDNHISDNLTVSKLAKITYISQSTLERKFNEYLNMKPFEFIKNKRMILAAEMLKKGESVLNTGINVGYSDNSHFIKLFKEYYGITPLQFKKRGM